MHILAKIPSCSLLLVCLLLYYCFSVSSFILNILSLWHARRYMLIFLKMSSEKSNLSNCCLDSVSVS